MCKDTFNLWAFGDAHVGTDLKRGRHSLRESLRLPNEEVIEVDRPSIGI
jgi:hypothetical protein